MGKWNINPKKLTRSFSKIVDLGEDVPVRVPETLTESDWSLFQRILSARTMDEVADISDEEIIRLSAFIEPVVTFLEHKGELADASAIGREFSKIIPFPVRKRRVL